MKSVNVTKTYTDTRDL